MKKKFFIFSLVFCVLFGSVLGVSAAGGPTYTFNGTEYSAYYTNTQSKYIYDFVTNNGGHAYMFKTNGYVKLFVSDVPLKSNGVNLYSDSAGTVYHMEYVDTGSFSTSYWGYVSTINVQPTGTINGYGVSNLVWAIDNVYQNNGSLVLQGDANFPKPLLAEVVGQSAEEALTKMNLTLGGILKVLVPCGVGCLALLVGLKLFGKRSLIFRS